MAKDPGVRRIRRVCRFLEYIPGATPRRPRTNPAIGSALSVRRIFWTWVGAAGAAILAAAPVVLTAASQSAQIGATRSSVVGYARSILVNQWFLGDTPTIYEGGPLGDGPGSQLWKYSCVLLAVGCWLVVAYGVCRRPSTPTPSDGPGLRPLLLCWLILPTSVLVAYALLATPIYNPRYLTYSAPALALLLGLGLVRARTGLGTCARCPGDRTVHDSRLRFSTFPIRQEWGRLADGRPIRRATPWARACCLFRPPHPTDFGCNREHLAHRTDALSKCVYRRT